MEFIMGMDIKFTHKKQKPLGKSLRAFADRQSAIQCGDTIEILVKNNLKDTK